MVVPFSASGRRTSGRLPSVRVHLHTPIFITHHVHKGGPHLVHPHVGTRTAEPVDNDFGGRGHVKRFAGPVPDGRHIRERHVQQRRVPSASPRVVQQKPRVHLNNRNTGGKKNPALY